MTRDEFAENWQRWHYPTMNLKAEVPFYYDIYKRFCTIAKSCSLDANEFYISQILMYVENMAHLKLDEVYVHLYRRSEDMIGHWCGLLKLDSQATQKIRMVADEAIKSAPESALVKWIQESVASNDFNNLKSVALYFSQCDMAIGLLLPNSHYREKVTAVPLRNRRA